MNYPGDYDVVNPLWQRGMAYGVEQERQRIIALLEAERDRINALLKPELASLAERSTIEIVEEFALESAIRLIKGENE